MFIVNDKRNRIVAYHKKYKVVEKYVEYIERFHDMELFIIKVKHKYEEYLNLDPELELVEFNDTYIQSGFTEYYSMESYDYDTSIRVTKDTLFRILQSDELSNKDLKSIKKTLNIIDKIDFENTIYTPTLDELITYRDQYLQYINSVNSKY